MILQLLVACELWPAEAIIEDDYVHIPFEPSGIPIRPDKTDLPDYNFNQFAFGDDVAYVDMDTNDVGVCAVGIDGEIVCFGQDRNGELHPPPGPFERMSLAKRGGCAQAADASWTCWGFTEQDADWLPGGADWPQESVHNLEVQNTGICALNSQGSPICWGRRVWSGLPSGPFSKLAMSVYGTSACGLRSDTMGIECWNFSGPLDEDYDLSGTFDDVAFRGGTVVGVRTDGTLAWAGNESYYTSTVPQGNNFVAVSVYGNNACSLTDTGSTECWMYDSKGLETWNRPDRNYIHVEVGTGWAAVRDDEGQIVLLGQVPNLPEY